jgi:hypothetical protein
MGCFYYFYKSYKIQNHNMNNRGNSSQPEVTIEYDEHFVLHWRLSAAAIEEAELLLWFWQNSKEDATHVVKDKDVKRQKTIDADVIKIK